MRTGAFLTGLRRRDIQVWADGDKLRCNAPSGALTPELRDELKSRKREILEFLHSAGTLAAQQRAIVPLQPAGTRPPVFALGGHNGDVFCYRDLVNHLGDDQPLFGLQPPGLDGRGEPLTRIEDLAEYFAGQILEFQPQGPCIVAGYCAGGTIAFELARRLERRGKPVRFLAMIGAPYPTRFRHLTMLREVIRRQAHRAVKYGGALWSRPLGEWRQLIAEALRRRDETRGESADDPVLALRAGVERATLAAGRRYSPGRFDGRLCIFMPSEAWTESLDKPLRWKRHARHVELYSGPVECDPDKMLLEPNAAAFARLFREAAGKKHAASDAHSEDEAGLSPSAV